MSKHFDVLTKFKLRVDAEQFDLGNQEDRTMLCCAVRFDSLIPRTARTHLRPASQPASQLPATYYISPALCCLLHETYRS